MLMDLGGGRGFSCSLYSSVAIGGICVLCAVLSRLLACVHILLSPAQPWKLEFLSFHRLQSL